MEPIEQLESILVIIAAIATTISVAFIATQAVAVGSQAKTAFLQLDEFTRRSKTEIAYQMISKFFDPESSRMIRDSVTVLSNDEIPAATKVQEIKGRQAEFSYNFSIMATYMEGLAVLYLGDHLDRVLIKDALYSAVIGSFRETERSGVIRVMREEQETVFRRWQELVELWEGEGPPH